MRIQEANPVIISDIFLEAAEKCAADNNIHQAVRDYKEILTNSDVEAVLICSSTDTHARIIVEAAEAGKDIFCEKPISHDLRLIDEALEAVEKAGVKLQIGFNRRFDADYRRVQEYIKEELEILTF